MSTGLLSVLSAPRQLLAHIQWTLDGVSDSQSELMWLAGAPNLELSAQASWAGGPEAGATLASALMNLKLVCFEVIQYADERAIGQRWSFNPRLGMFHAQTDEAGNVLVGENQLVIAIEKAGPNVLRLQAELRRLLGQQWDDELEPLRELVNASEGNNGIVTAEAEGIAYRQYVRPS